MDHRLCEIVVNEINVCINAFHFIHDKQSRNKAVYYIIQYTLYKVYYKGEFSSR